MINENKFNDSNLLKKIAGELGYNVSEVTSKKNRLTLNISKNNKFYIANAGSYGYYPDNRRWHTALFKNKIQSGKLLKELGYSFVKSHDYTVSNLTLNEIISDLENLSFDFPIIIKPNDGMKGKDIKYIDTLSQLIKEATARYEENCDFCVQPIIEDKEYRILYVNNSVQVVHSKSLNVITGDGYSSVEKLLSEQASHLSDNDFLQKELVNKGIDIESILEEGHNVKTHITKITHGESVNEIYFNDNIPEAVKTWTSNLGKDLSSSVMGIDIFATDINNPDTFKIIEINSNPAFSYIVNKFNGYNEIKKMWEDTLSAYFSN
ncbi:hypothetical protein KC926_01255 [Candidatus Kaiserbacteria bacterium]|nr:hypothetical protein [Candidatus Kaiserbacteria bacterium]